MKQLNLLFSGLLLAATVATSQTPAEQWHEYCEMTVHVTVDGWELNKSETVASIPLNTQTLTCEATLSRDFQGRVYTRAKAILSKDAVSGLSSLNLIGVVSEFAVYEGTVDEEVACAPVKTLLKQAAAAGGTLDAKVAKKMIRQDWTSSLNTDVRTVEEVTIVLPQNFRFSGAAILNLRGKFCSKKP